MTLQSKSQTLSKSAQFHNRGRHGSPKPVKARNLTAEEITQDAPHLTLDRGSEQLICPCSKVEFTIVYGLLNHFI